MPKFFPRFETGMYEVRVFFSGTSVLSTTVPNSYEDIWSRDGSIQVDRVVFHPLYDHNNFHFDIAVLRLRNSVSGIDPVALPQQGGESVEIKSVVHKISIKIDIKSEVHKISIKIDIKPEVHKISIKINIKSKYYIRGA